MSDQPENQRKEDFERIFRKGEDFTRELVEENEKLRFKIASLQQKMDNAAVSADPSGAAVKLREERDRLAGELKSLQDRMDEVEKENEDFARRYVEIEEENNNLANLYIASYQLHSTLNFKEVLQIIMEIIINLIGSEVFALLLLDEKTQKLTPVAAEGLELDDIPVVQLGVGKIGQVAATGESYLVSDQEIVHDGPIEYQEPLVCIPLKIKEEVIGIIVIYRLLEQKTGLAEVDYELFTLLAGHAATAIFSSRSYSAKDRKLATIQNFIELLTK